MVFSDRFVVALRLVLILRCLVDCSSFGDLEIDLGYRGMGSGYLESFAGLAVRRPLAAPPGHLVHRPVWVSVGVCAKHVLGGSPKGRAARQTSELPFWSPQRPATTRTDPDT